MRETLTLLAHSGVGVAPEAMRAQAADDARLLRQLRLGATPTPQSSGVYSLENTHDDMVLGTTLESVKQRFGRMGLEVSWDGTTLDLTPTEFGLLAALAAVPGRAYSRYELVNRVHGYEFAGYERSIDSHVKNLRHKLGADGAAVVETVHGVGYRLGLRRDR